MANEPQKTPSKGKAEAMVVPVINNLEAFQQIAMRPERGIGTLVPAEALTLKPGVNFVDTEKWAQAAENPHTKKLMELKIPPSKAPQFNRECVGKLYIVALPHVLPKDHPLGGLDEEKAVQLVEEMNDAREVERYEKIEQRGKVHSALRTRHLVLTKKADRAS